MSKYQIHQIDTNQAEIIEALEVGGFSVVSIGRPLDLLVGKAGKTYLIEVKRPKGKLRESQKEFLAKWKGHAVVLRSIEDVQQFLRGLT